MDIDEQSERAQQLVSAWLLRQYRAGDGEAAADKKHLQRCSEATTSETEGGDGFYGCDTGCEYLRLETTITCPHGESETFRYGTFGDLADILEDVLALADRQE